MSERPIYGAEGIIAISKSDLFSDKHGYVRRLGTECVEQKERADKLTSKVKRLEDAILHLLYGNKPEDNKEIYDLVVCKGCIGKVIKTPLEPDDYDCKYQMDCDDCPIVIENQRKEAEENNQKN